jgi:hypothetical protein
MISSARNLSELRCGSGYQTRRNIGRASARRMRSVLKGLLAVILFAGCVFIPGVAAAQAPQTQSKPKAAVPVTMTECEGTNNCATWTFLGGQGNGNWPSGEIANLSVEKSDDNSVVIRRADSTGASAGLTATYTGTRNGDQVGGQYTSSWPGHWDNKSGQWYATVEKNPVGPPSVIHFCAVNCFTLNLEQGHFVAKTDSGVIFSTWTVESFTRESVILRRRDTNGFGGVYAGQISKEGGSLVNQTFNGQFDAAKITWGPQLNSTPGSNAERDRGKPPQPQVIVPLVRPAICVPWFFTIVCG